MVVADGLAFGEGSAEALGEASGDASGEALGSSLTSGEGDATGSWEAVGAAVAMGVGVGVGSRRVQPAASDKTARQAATIKKILLFFNGFASFRLFAVSGYGSNAE